MWTFICAINANTANEDAKNKRKETLQDNPKKRSQELEYLLILIDRYIGNEKPAMLAKMYLAYIDGSISWEVLAVCAEIIDRLLPGDYELLQTNHDISVRNNIGEENAFRLIALGLLKEKDIVYSNESLILHCTIEDSTNTSTETIHNYERTILGDKFVEVIKD